MHSLKSIMDASFLKIDIKYLKISEQHQWRQSIIYLTFMSTVLRNGVLQKRKKPDHWRQQENVRLVDWKCWQKGEKLKVLHNPLIHKWMRRWTMLLRGVVQNNCCWLPKPAWSSSASGGTTHTRCWKIHHIRCISNFGDDNVNPTRNLLESTAKKRTNDAKFKKKPQGNANEAKQSIVHDF
jgi:hypothetical protein